MINPSRIFGAIGLTGGGDKTLDSLPSSLIKGGDVAIACEGLNVYFYRLSDESNLEENSPYIIKPDDVSSSVDPLLNSKRWNLISQKHFVDDIIQSPDKYIQTSGIKAIEGQGITFTSSNNIVVSIDVDGKITLNDTTVNGQITINTGGLKPPFIVDSTLKVINLNADKLDGYSSDLFTLTNGSRSFTEPVGGIAPVEQDDLTTKGWVEDYTSGFVSSTAKRGITALVQGANNITVTIGATILTPYSISITMENLIDGTPSIYSWIVRQKNQTSFVIEFGDNIDSPNYNVNWTVSPIT